MLLFIFDQRAKQCPVLLAFSPPEVARIGLELDAPPLLAAMDEGEKARFAKALVEELAIRARMPPRRETEAFSNLGSVTRKGRCMARLVHRMTEVHRTTYLASPRFSLR